MTLGSRPQVLYVTHRVPYPPDRGYLIRSYHFLRWLAERADVHLACLADEPPDALAEEHLRKLCCRLAIVPVRPLTCRLMAGWSLVRGRSATEGWFGTKKLLQIVSRW